MARAAYKLGLAKDDFYKDLIEAYKNHNLPTYYDFDTDKILEVLKHDKKIKNNIINLIIPTEIGQVISKKMNFDDLREFIELGKDDE